MHFYVGVCEIQECACAMSYYASLWISDCVYFCVGLDSLFFLLSVYVSLCVIVYVYVYLPTLILHMCICPNDLIPFYLHWFCFMLYVHVFWECAIAFIIYGICGNVRVLVCMCVYLSVWIYVCFWMHLKIPLTLILLIILDFFIIRMFFCWVNMCVYVCLSMCDHLLMLKLILKYFYIFYPMYIVYSELSLFMYVFMCLCEFVYTCECMVYIVLYIIFYI